MPKDARGNIEAPWESNGLPHTVYRQRVLRALATQVSGKNPDNTDFISKVEVVNPSGGGGVGLTNTELRAAPVEVAIPAALALDAATLEALEQITATVDNWPAYLTNTQLRESPVPVSVDTTKLTDPSTGGVMRVKAQTPASNDYGAVVRNIPSGNQDVTVTNLPAVQPVSDNGGSLTVDGTVNVGNFPATQAVTGPLTNAELRASNVPVTVSNPTASPETGLAKDTTLTSGSQKTQVTNFPASQVVEHKPNTLTVSQTAAAGAAVTATLPAPGAGLFHYITSIQIVKYAVAAITGTATPVVVTTTNFPTAVAFTFPTAQTIGSIVEQKMEPTAAIRSLNANTATTIVCPAVANTIWRINVLYYTGA